MNQKSIPTSGLKTYYTRCPKCNHDNCILVYPNIVFNACYKCGHTLNIPNKD